MNENGEVSLDEQLLKGCFLYKIFVIHFEWYTRWRFAAGLCHAVARSVFDEITAFTLCSRDAAHDPDHSTSSLSTRRPSSSLEQRQESPARTAGAADKPH